MTVELAGAEPLGQMLRRLRQAADLTLEALSAASGVSDRTISDIERGAARGPQHRTVVAVVDALRPSPADRAALLRAAREGRRRSRAEPAWRLPLPRGVGDFTGREPELARLRSVLAPGGTDAPDHATSPRELSVAPVVVVTGPPGYGKTTLAIRAAQILHGAFDEVLFLQASGGPDGPNTPGDVGSRLVRALTGTAAPSASDPGQLRALLAERRVLVVLDDVATEPVVRAVLPGRGRSAVLVTSRSSLAGLENVSRVPVGRMEAADARALLARIAPEGEADPKGLDRVAQLCDAVPLALRIAGNRLASRPGWTASGLADRLERPERRLDTLVAGDLQVRAAIDVSHDQLRPAASDLFHRLALVDGSTFGAGLATLLAGITRDDVEEGLDDLLTLSLIQPADRDRFALHDLLRVYACERLTADVGPQALARLHEVTDEEVLATTVRAGRWFEPGHLGARSQQPGGAIPLATADEAHSWLVEESDTWLSAMRRAAAAGRHERVVEVAESMHWFSGLWTWWAHWHEVYSLSVAAAQALGDAATVATHLGYLAWAYVYCQGDPAAGEAVARRAQRVAENVGDPALEAWGWFYRAWAELAQHRGSDALDSVRNATRLFLEADDREGTPQALQLEASALSMLGRRDAAVATLRDVVARARDPLTKPRGQVAEFTALSALSSIARLGVEAEDWGSVLGPAGEAIDGFVAHAAEPAAARLYVLRARARRELGQADDAVTDLDRARELLMARGDNDALTQVEDLLLAWSA